MEGKALGKGLSALIPEKIETANSANVAFLKTESIKNSRFQPRTNYDDASLEELKNSIKEKGVLQPILVREKDGGYEVIAGERRLKAARALNLKEVPVIIKSVTDQEALVIALIENIQREQLNAIEEAQAYQKLIDEFHYTQEEIAKAVAKDRSTIGNGLRLLKLPKEIQDSVYAGNLSVGHARALLAAVSTSEMQRLFKLTLKKGLSVRELEVLVRPADKGISRRGKDEARPAQVMAVEDGLQKLLGTKVRINFSKKRGNIVIDFYSPDDLNRIVRAMMK